MKTKTQIKCNCETQKPLFTEFDSLKIFIIGDKINISYDAYSCDSSFETEISIAFCPYCGRKLVN